MYSRLVISVAACIASASAFTTVPRSFGVVNRIALNAEPAVADEWKEVDYEAQLATLEKEAEKRLDDKVAELMGDIEKVGK